MLLLQSPESLLASVRSAAKEAKEEATARGSMTGSKTQGNRRQKKWLKQYVKKLGGMKHIMTLLASRGEGEQETSALISALSSAAITPAAAVPATASGQAPAISSVNAKLNGSATVMTLNSIMRKGGK